MWFTILDFLNFAGVVTNAFLIAFTAKWGRDLSISSKLWVIIGFEVSTQYRDLYPNSLAAVKFDQTPFNIFHAASECRRQVKNVTKFVKNVEIVEFHDHI